MYISIWPIQSLFISYIPIFTVLNKLLSIYYTIKYITIGTIPHYVKHMKNVKVVYTKETITTSNDFTEAVTQKQSNGKMPQKYAAHPQKNSHADMQIQ